MERELHFLLEQILPQRFAKIEKALHNAQLKLDPTQYTTPETVDVNILANSFSGLSTSSTQDDSLQPFLVRGSLQIQGYFITGAKLLLRLPKINKGQTIEVKIINKEPYLLQQIFKALQLISSTKPIVQTIKHLNSNSDQSVHIYSKLNYLIKNIEELMSIIQQTREFLTDTSFSLIGKTSEFSQFTSNTAPTYSSRTILNYQEFTLPTLTSYNMALEFSLNSKSQLQICLYGLTYTNNNQIIEKHIMDTKTNVLMGVGNFTSSSGGGNLKPLSNASVATTTTSNSGTMITTTTNSTSTTSSVITIATNTTNAMESPTLSPTNDTTTTTTSLTSVTTSSASSSPGPAVSSLTFSNGDVMNVTFLISNERSGVLEGFMSDCAKTQIQLAFVKTIMWNLRDSFNELVQLRDLLRTHRN